MGSCAEILEKVRKALDELVQKPDATVTTATLCEALGIDSVETLTGYEQRCPEYEYERERIGAALQSR